ncbi:MAG: hypothetical protein QF473_09075 [Planctomycetota bacterium]|jgi:hypothetical protein|nr:hypothetical protein [Planctomycetota bacterium]
MQHRNYSSQELESLLENKQFSEVREACFQRFTEDHYNVENNLYLVRAVIGQLVASAKANVTAEVLEHFINVGMQFGAVPDEAFSCFFSMYENYLKQNREELPEKGKVLLVIGTGRNGSTSIGAALKKLPNSFITHERPPVIFWDKEESQLDFHIRFFELARKYYEYVIDVSHWWLPHLDYMRERLSGLQVIHLQREISKTLDSWVRIKEITPGLINHWTDHQGNYWDRNLWDKCYPNVIAFNELGGADNHVHMRISRLFCISKYIVDYHLAAQKEIESHNGLNLEIESLFSDDSRKRVLEFLGCEFDWSRVHLNEGNMKDSQGAPIFL